MSNPLFWTKMDRRNLGHDSFAYFVTTSDKKGTQWTTMVEEQDNFAMLRDTCIKEWGNSCERDLYLNLDAKNHIFSSAPHPWYQVNPYWAWHIDIRLCQYRIYLKSEKEVLWLKLKWS